MKKVSLMLGALALVFGLSQCKKQDEAAQGGVKLHVVLRASNGNDGSKVAAEFASAALNLTWEGTETIEVSGGATGTLTCVDGQGNASATFEGYITKGENGGDIVFTVGAAPASYAGQAGTEEDCASWINAHNHFVGTSTWEESGHYSATMELQYAVLKLDVSALGTGEMTIKVGEEIVASVSDVTSSSASEVFVAVRANGEETAYTIACGDKNAEKTWTLNNNVFYTENDETGHGTGDAIVIEPAAPFYGPFSVGNGKKVEFAPGNLYWDGNDLKFEFEDNQWDTNPTSVASWDDSHVSHFYWSSDAGKACTESYDDIGASGDDVFFTNVDGFTVNDQGGWFALSRDEWFYLLESDRMVNGKLPYAWKEIEGKTGLCLYPDDYNGDDTVATSAALAEAGVVFLPAAGDRDSGTVYDVWSVGVYWSASPYCGDHARYLYFSFGNVGVYTRDRLNGFSVRLVRLSED